MSDCDKPVGISNTHLLLPNSNSEIALEVEHLSANELQLIADQPVQSIAQDLSAASLVTHYINAAIADNTRLAYQQDLRDFLIWGGTIPCSPDTLAAYVSDRAQILSAHTITRRLVGISRAHVSQGLADPAKTDLVRTVMRGVRRVKGTAQRQVSPLLKSDVLSIVAHMQGVKGARDRALILLGYCAALRRSELAALDFTDLEFVNEGVIVHLRKSKTDQIGAGRKIGVPWGRTSTCPVKAIKNWLQVAQIDRGPLFRSVNRAGVVGCNKLHGQSIALVLKSYTELIGHDPSNFSGHSLRAGLVTSAIQAGVSVHKVQQQTGHKSVAMLSRYIRDAGLFEGNAAGSVL